MFKKLMNKKMVNNEKGLTLIELLAVIVILAIVAAIAIPAIGNIIDNSRYNAVKADAINVINGAQLYYTDNPGGEEASGTGDTAIPATTESITVSQLIKAGYVESAGKMDTGAKVYAEKPHVLDGDSKQLVNGNKISFKATIDQINADTAKGSSIDKATTIGTQQ